ncbi:MAG TPA: EamA family transporter [Anaerolineae bacterium]|nr:EamA family transporter [Anaerolineae bacterium]
MSVVLQSILAGLGGMLGWGLYDFLGGLFSRKLGNFKTLFWSQLAGMALALALAAASAMPWRLRPQIALLLAAASVLYALAYLLFFRGFELGKVSLISATMNLYAVFTILFAFVLLGQRLSAFQSLGVALILAGVTLVSLKGADLRQPGVGLLSGVRETVLAALLFGFFWILSEIISEEIGWLATTLFVKIGLVLFLLLVGLVGRKPLGMAGAGARTGLMIALAGVLEAAAVACVNWGLAVGDVILVTPIASALSVVTIGMAVVVMRERITRVQGAGMLLVLAGIVSTAF